MRLITTSWDDGHPLDFRIAELLEKYNMQGTFYIPKENPENEVMLEEEVSELAKKFEIGGHTLHHTRLHNVSSTVMIAEIKGCYEWLYGICNHYPESFCFPGGAFNNTAISYVEQQGFKVIRTTELFSTKVRNSNGLVPTTLQVYEHNRYTYTKHLLKRQRIMNLLSWLQNGAPVNLLKVLDEKIKQIDLEGGVFHLWGHSWEIEECNLWNQLEMLLKHLSGISGFDYIPNKKLAQIQ
jgi:peptidoglycan-N-acetylglucosamine deacetylase